MFKQLFFAITLILLLGVGWFYYPKNKPVHQNISVIEFDAILASQDPFVVDVHTPEQAHIEGTDAFIDFTQVNQRLDEFPQDKDSEILVYCRSGSMSQTAAQTLIDAGFTNVKNLVGGINAWREQHQGVIISPAQQSLGTVIYGNIASTSFSFQNNTSQILKLTRISTSCSCTQAKAQAEIVKPWESTEIIVTFNPAVHKDDTDLGDLTRTIYIETDNPNFSQLTATITATVIKE